MRWWETASFLAGWLTVATKPWYRAYQLHDQHLAGLIMWIPAGVIFMIVGLALFAAWLGESERRVRISEP